MFLTPVTATIGGKTWTPPTEADIPADSVGASVRRGLALVRHMTDSLPDYAPGHINCTNCHLQDGRARYASPLIGAYSRYPKYIQRSAAVVTIADRVNFCMTRSLAGNRLPTDSREMTDIIMYLAWLSKGLPMGMQTPGSDGLPTLKAASAPDATHGAQIYAAKCQSCHQADGAGMRAAAGAAPAPAGVPTTVPALWGQTSYSIGASMARVERAASFIAHNMPYGQPGTLTTQEAFDVAAYINSQPRPDHPAKENDWPAGGVPADLPYNTKSGHTRNKSTAPVATTPSSAHTRATTTKGGDDELSAEPNSGDVVSDLNSSTDEKTTGVSRRQLLTNGVVLAGGVVASRFAPAQGAAPQKAAAPPPPPPPVVRPVAPLDAALVPGAPTGPLGLRSPFENPSLAPIGVTTGSTLTPLQALQGTITPSDLHFQRHHNGVPLIDPDRWSLTCMVS